MKSAALQPIFTDLKLHFIQAKLISVIFSLNILVYRFYDLESVILKTANILFKVYFPQRASLVLIQIESINTVSVQLIP